MSLRAFRAGIIWIHLICASAAQQSVLPNDQGFQYMGRMSFVDPLNPIFSMSASGFRINFEGSTLAGRFSTEGGDSYLYVIIDGKADPENRIIIKVDELNEDSYVLAQNLSNGPHTLEVLKLNESHTKVTFHGIVLDNGRILPPSQRPNLQLEFVGDSNTAGWSAWDAYDKGSDEYSGAYYTYPGITAKLLNAEYSLIGGSSSGVTQKAPWNLYNAYERIHLKEANSEQNKWNFKDNYWG
ncbi:MAG: hypothetical protein HRU40_22145, partial [Saprospiraceae bacterium]|nr:hypothetical protein [Saprospiraceae bacterium]